MCDVTIIVPTSDGCKGRRPRAKFQGPSRKQANSAGFRFSGSAGTSKTRMSQNEALKPHRPPHARLVEDLRLPSCAALNVRLCPSSRPAAHRQVARLSRASLVVR